MNSVCACECAEHGIAGKKNLKTSLSVHTSNLRRLICEPVPDATLNPCGSSQLVYTRGAELSSWSFCTALQSVASTLIIHT